MAKTRKGPESGLPPYFNITADTARDDLVFPASTATFARIAQACSQSAGDQTASDTGANPGPDTAPLRLFSTWEITRYLIPVAAAHFRRVLKLNPDLPQGHSDTEGGAKWFTLEQVQRLRQHFATQGAKARNYSPYRPAGRRAKIVTLANARAGSGKTTTAAHLAMSAAMDGYRVLVVDMDGQGGLTSIFGGQVSDHWQTAFVLLARHYASHQRHENQQRINRGEAPRPIDEMVLRALDMGCNDLIRKTRWANIDLIGAGLDLYRGEGLVARWRMEARGWHPWQALRDRLAEDGALETYDLIFIDTGPVPGQLTICALAAGDIVLVPLAATPQDCTASAQFLSMVHDSFQIIEEEQNIAARALGRPALRFEWDAVQLLVTRFDATRQAGFAGLMQGHLGRRLAPHSQAYTALIGDTGGEGDRLGEGGPGEGGQVRTVYEADYRDTNRETYARARESFDAGYGAFKRLLAGLWYRESRGKSEGGTDKGGPTISP
jgi:chromosome partitioning protein